MDPYAEVWQRFAGERRLEFGGHTDPAWQDGHSFSAALMVPVDTTRLRDRLDPLREALRPFPFVSLHPDRFMHITLLLLGFLTDEPKEPDEISGKRLEEIKAGARDALASFPAATATLANLNAFPGAAFVEVHDGGVLERVRDALYDVCGLRRAAGPPHLTIAYFHAPDGTPVPDPLISAISRYRDWPVGEIPIKSVELTSLDLRKYYPRPEVLATIPLK